MDSATTGQLVGIVIAVLISLGVYIWSSLALSGVFRKVGEEPWQAWLPVWNSAVLLRVGGYSPWLVLLVLVPALGQVAFLVVFVMACHRVTVGFGYGAGMTVVAVLWNPIWASVLAWGGATWSRPAPPQAYLLPQGYPPQAYPPPQGYPAQGYPAQPAPWTPQAPWLPPAQAAPPLISSAFAPPLEPAGTPPPPAPQWHPVPPVTPPEDAAAGPEAGAGPGPVNGEVPDAGQPAPDVPPTPPHGPAQANVSSPGTATAPLSIGDWNTDTQIPAFVPPAAPPGPPPAPSAAPPSAPSVPPAAPSVPPAALPVPPATPAVPAPPSAPLVGGIASPPAEPPAQPAHDPLADLRWAPPPDVFRTVTPPAAAPPPAPEVLAAAVPGRLPDGGPPAEPEPIGEPEPPDRTMLASRLRPSWTLVTSAELVLALTGSEVLLGRQPAADPHHPGAQLLILPDPTRTVSKVHALLRLVDGAWLVRDLGSTNGVTLVEPDGTERMLDDDAEAPLTARFFLGDAEFELRAGPPRP